MKNETYSLGEKRQTLHLPEVVRSRPVYDGQVVNLRVDEIMLASGATANREVVEHAGAVAVIALDSNDRVYLVEQYRHAIGRTLLELPAGTLEPEEEPLHAAQRELREEVGLLGSEWSGLGSFFSTPGFSNEVLHVFLTRGLTETERDPDDDEEFNVIVVPLADLQSGTPHIIDAKSLAALNLLTQARSGNGYRS